LTGRQGEQDRYVEWPQEEDEDAAEDRTKKAKHHRSSAQSEEKELEQLKNELQAEKEKAENYLNQWKRTQADFDNYRRRTDQEKAEISQNTTCLVLGNILPVMDDLDRALASIPEESADLPWVDGIKLIYKKFQSIIQSMGVEELCALGQPFDPALHEAVAHMEGDEGKVINEIQKGYKLRDKLVRPSQVVVGKGIENSDEEPE
jgi:molecular chaperone GrpE